MHTFSATLNQHQSASSKEMPTNALGAAGRLQDPSGIWVTPELLHEEIVVSWEHEGRRQEVQVNVASWWMETSACTSL